MDSALLFLVLFVVLVSLYFVLSPKAMADMYGKSTQAASKASTGTTDATSPSKQDTSPSSSTAAPKGMEAWAIALIVLVAVLIFALIVYFFMRNMKKSPVGTGDSTSTIPENGSYTFWKKLSDFAKKIPNLELREKFYTLIKSLREKEKKVVDDAKKASEGRNSNSSLYQDPVF
jgi:hypothetical protein